MNDPIKTIDDGGESVSADHIKPKIMAAKMNAQEKATKCWEIDKKENRKSGAVSLQTLKNWIKAAGWNADIGHLP